MKKQNLVCWIKAIRTEEWTVQSKCLFCNSSWFAKAAPINLCSNLRVSAMHSKPNCGLFYSVGVKALVWCWMLSGEWGSQDAQHCCWHNTIPERPTTWFSQAKCHSNCEDLYQWERADEVPQLSDLTDLIWAQMLPAALKACRLTNFDPECSTSDGIDRAVIFHFCKSSVKWNF